MSGGHTNAGDTPRWWASPCTPTHNATVSAARSVLVATAGAHAVREGVVEQLHARPAQGGQVGLGQGAVGQVGHPEPAEHRAVAPGVRLRVAEVAVADRDQPLPGAGRGVPGRAEFDVQFGEGVADDGQHDRGLVGEVAVDRRRGDPDVPRDRAQGDGAFVARLVEQLDRRRHDLVAQAGALAAAVAGAGRGAFGVHAVSLRHETYKR